MEPPSTQREQKIALLRLPFIALIISFAIKDWVESGVIAATIGVLINRFNSLSRTNSRFRLVLNEVSCTLFDILLAVLPQAHSFISSFASSHTSCFICAALLVIIVFAAARFMMTNEFGVCSDKTRALTIGTFRPFPL
jgi:hypothetical protein